MTAGSGEGEQGAGQADAGASSEFARGWKLVTCASVGTGLGISGLLTYNSGLFFDGLQRDFGLSRTVYGAAFFASTITLAATMPLVARIVDRQGPRLAAAIGAAGLAVAFLALSFVNSVFAYVAIMLLTGIIAATSAPVAYTRAVAAAFTRSRGLALGIVQVGIGLAAALVPPLVGATIADDGWRSGFLLLALLAALGIVPALAGLPGPASRSSPQSERPTVTFRADALYRTQLVAFTAMALAFAGMLPHFVPMLTASGIPIAQAGAMAGTIGLSVIVTRIVVGWLADRIEPAWLGSASCLICAAGCLVLAFGGIEMALVGAVALGAAMGAEADLIGILTARYVGVAAYSQAYSRQYAAFIVAAGVSPLWVGYLADTTGGYTLPLAICSAGLLVPAVLFTRLPRLDRHAA